mmetsp:Transcript_9353/g.13726  ORF Transcript_9353/g.13726 Transcript_9353/m.13726 type:complete len:221 (+) Transcript_9353:206-868(+)
MRRRTRCSNSWTGCRSRREGWEYCTGPHHSSIASGLRVGGDLVWLLLAILAILGAYLYGFSFAIPPAKGGIFLLSQSLRCLFNCLLIWNSFKPTIAFNNKSTWRRHFFNRSNYLSTDSSFLIASSRHVRWLECLDEFAEVGIARMVLNPTPSSEQDVVLAQLWMGGQPSLVPSLNALLFVLVMLGGRLCSCQLNGRRWRTTRPLRARGLLVDREVHASRR